MELIFDNNALEIKQEDRQLTTPFQWKDITALNLTYKPYGLHELVIEVNTKSFLKNEVVPYVTLFYCTEHVFQIEQAIKAKGLMSVAKNGIPRGLLEKPFAVIYSRPTRKLWVTVSKVFDVILLMCFMYSLSKDWFFCPTLEDGTGDPKCKAVLPPIIETVTPIFWSLVTPATLLINNYCLPLYELLKNNYPYLYYPLLGIFLLFSIPFWLWWFSLFLVVFFAKYAVNSYILVLIYVKLGVLLNTLKGVKSVGNTFMNVLKTIWSLPFSTIKKKIQPPTPVKKKTS